mmetsp:Transcript_3717/g.5472  ORF Transcript_3717/g.5472 Transcript_3717/m.5472 type:complete len:184 (+) Transcript_3717:125-676(+)
MADNEENPVKPPTTSNSPPQQGGDLDDADISQENVENGENNGLEEKPEEEIPVEMQYHEVDMDNLDPLEWSARKVVPIPKKYYWDTGNFDLPLRIKAWHRTVSALERLTHAAEKTGEVAANMTGLNSTRFDYVTSTMTEEELEEARIYAEECKKRRAEQRAKKAREIEEEQLAEDAGLSSTAI